jgi:hypothetical protein
LRHGFSRGWDEGCQSSGKVAEKKYAIKLVSLRFSRRLTHAGSA